MALDFGKLNFSISLNPTSAFPLDARSYFESLAAAEAAAASAKEVGSAESVYYYGQQIVVVENSKADFYIIQPDNTLSPVGGSVEINTNVFAHVNDKLDLLGFADAVAGAQLTKGSDGKISWIKPDTTTVEGLSSAVESLRTDIDNLTNNTYTKIQVDEKIAKAGHLSRKIVEKVESIDPTAEDAEKFIYMVPTGLQNDDNKYYEYIVIDGVVEPIGTWEIDLSGYAKTEDVNEALEGKVDAVEGHRLLTPTESALLATLQENAEPNFIKSVDTEQFTVTEGRLELLNIAQSKITGLTETLNNLVAKEEGKGLSTNDFTNEYKEKLDSINVSTIELLEQDVGALDRLINGVTDENGEVIEKGLADQVLDNNTAIGNLTELVETLQNTQSTLSETVETLSSTVEGNSSTIEELQTTVQDFETTYVSLANFNQVVGNMDALLNREASIIEQIDDIYERLEWGELTE